MLKRIVILALCCSMFLVSAFGEESIDIPEDLEPKEVISEQEILDEVDVADEMTDSLRAGEVKTADMSGLSIPMTTDLVHVDTDGTLTVVADGVSMSVQPPFGTMAFGQDAMEQFEIYAMFTDPGGMVQHLQNLGAHICVIDLTSGTEIYAMTGQDGVSLIVEDIDQVDDAVLAILLDKLQQTNPSADVSLVKYNGKNFIAYDYRKTNTEMIIFTSIKNNTNIDFILIPGSDVITDVEIGTMESVLSGVQLSVA